MSHSRPTLQALSTGLVVAIVGFFSSFPIVIKGIEKMGASDAEAASSLMAAAIAMGLSGIVISLWKKQPVSIAWSTPGVAFLAISLPSENGFAGAVGAFVFAGALTILAGLWQPLARLATSIPPALAQAMLAGVLFSLCVVPFSALSVDPVHTLPILLTWFLVSLLNRLFAVPAAVLMAAFVTAYAADFQVPLPDVFLSRPVFVMPAFSVADIIGIGLPLFIITMATQNIPGVAILKSSGYTPAPGPLLTVVGGASVLSAPLGAPATCLAAITAAMCASEDAHPDPEKRYWAAVSAGCFYCLFGAFAVVVTSFAALAPPLMLGTLAGVALLGVFAGSASAALQAPEFRQSAVITFLVTASGVAFFGLGAAVWGLLIGGLVQFLSHKFQR